MKVPVSNIVFLPVPQCLCVYFLIFMILPYRKHTPEPLSRGEFRLIPPLAKGEKGDLIK
jgi:hypothetical protein